MSLETPQEARRNRFLEIYERYLDGKSLRDIASEFKISYERVRQILKQGSTKEEFKKIREIANQRRLRTWETTEVTALLENGYSCSKVAKILNISLSSVKRVSAQYNKLKQSAA
jgi:transposase